MYLSIVDMFQSVIIIILIEAEFIFGTWNPLQVGSWVMFCNIILIVFSFLLSGITRYAKFILCISCLKSLIRKFPENPWILSLENIKTQDVHIVELIISRPFQWRRQWQPTPLLLPEKFHGHRSLVGYSPRGRRVGHGWVTSRSPTLMLRSYWKRTISGSP